MVPALRTPSVRGVMTFLRRANDDSRQGAAANKLIFYPKNASQAAAGEIEEWPGDTQEVPVQIFDARHADENESQPSLDREGFTLLSQPTCVSDFYDEDQVKSIFYGEVRSQMEQITGASRVLIFDHTRRSDDQRQRAERIVRESAVHVHGDYTPASGLKRIRSVIQSTEELRGQEREALQKALNDFLQPGEASASAESRKSSRGVQTALKRVAIVNLWRSCRGSVLRSPLALCDATSLSLTDLTTMERHASDGRVGEIYRVCHSDKQRWFYFPDLGFDEAILFKTFDTSGLQATDSQQLVESGKMSTTGLKDGGEKNLGRGPIGSEDKKPNICVHTSFKINPGHDELPPRESIEVRAALFWEE